MSTALESAVGASHSWTLKDVTSLSTRLMPVCSVTSQRNDWAGMACDRPPDDREKMIAAYQQMLTNGKVEVEAEARRKGSVFDQQMVMVKARPTAAIYWALLLYKDISRREIERLKDEFVSVVSHELRTPLTSIRGALGLSGLTTQPDKSQRMLEIAVVTLTVWCV